MRKSIALVAGAGLVAFVIGANLYQLEPYDLAGLTIMFLGGALFLVSAALLLFLNILKRVTGSEAKMKYGRYGKARKR